MSNIVNENTTQSYPNIHVLVFFANRHTASYDVLSKMPTLTIQVDDITKISNLSKAKDLIDCSPSQCNISWRDEIIRAPKYYSDYVNKTLIEMVRKYKQNIDGCWVLTRDTFDKLSIKENYHYDIVVGGSTEYSELAAYQMLSLLYQRFALYQLTHVDIVTGEHISPYSD